MGESSRQSIEIIGIFAALIGFVSTSIGIIKDVTFWQATILIVGLALIFSLLATYVKVDEKDETRRWAIPTKLGWIMAVVVFVACVSQFGSFVVSVFNENKHCLTEHDRLSCLLEKTEKGTQGISVNVSTSQLNANVEK